MTAGVSEKGFEGQEDGERGVVLKEPFRANL